MIEALIGAYVVIAILSGIIIFRTANHAGDPVDWPFLIGCSLLWPVLFVVLAFGN